MFIDTAEWYTVALGTAGGKTFAHEVKRFADGHDAVGRFELTTPLPAWLGSLQTRYRVQRPDPFDLLNVTGITSRTQWNGATTTTTVTAETAVTTTPGRAHDHHHHRRLGTAAGHQASGPAE